MFATRTFVIVSQALSESAQGRASLGRAAIWSVKASSSTHSGTKITESIFATEFGKFLLSDDQCTVGVVIGPGSKSTSVLFRLIHTAQNDEKPLQSAVE